MPTVTHTGTTEHGTVQIGSSDYKIVVLHFSNGHSQTELHGPRAVYFLRPFRERKGDSGLRQVISWKSGNPLRVRGNEVRVYLLGDIVEVVR